MIADDKCSNCALNGRYKIWTNLKHINCGPFSHLRKSKPFRYLTWRQCPPKVCFILNNGKFSELFQCRQLIQVRFLKCSNNDSKFKEKKTYEYSEYFPKKWFSMTWKKMCLKALRFAETMDRLFKKWHSTKQKLGLNRMQDIELGKWQLIDIVLMLNYDWLEHKNINR